MILKHYSDDWDALISLWTVLGAADGTISCIAIQDNIS